MIRPSRQPRFAPTVTAGGSGTSTTLSPLLCARRTRWPRSWPDHRCWRRWLASKILRPSRPNMTTRAKSFGFVDSRATWSRPRTAHALARVLATLAGLWIGERASWRLVENAIDHASAVETGDHRQAAGHGGRPKPADLLHPPQLQLQVCPRRSQGIQALVLAPQHVATKVGLWPREGLRPVPGSAVGIELVIGVHAGLTFQPGQRASHDKTEWVGSTSSTGESCRSRPAPCGWSADDKCRPAHEAVKTGDAIRQMRTSLSSLDRRA
jgi:hypothetical protein